MQYTAQFTISPDIRPEEKDRYVKHSMVKSYCDIGRMIAEQNGFMIGQDRNDQNVYKICVDAFIHARWVEFKRQMLCCTHPWDMDMRKKMEDAFTVMESYSNRPVLEKDGVIFPEIKSIV